MKDVLMSLNSFGLDVVNAMNKAGVKPSDMDINAVMIVVGSPKTHGTPIVASVNYDKDKELWELDVEVDQSTRV